MHIQIAFSHLASSFRKFLDRHCYPFCKIKAEPGGGEYNEEGNHRKKQEVSEFYRCPEYLILFELLKRVGDLPHPFYKSLWDVTVNYNNSYDPGVRPTDRGKAAYYLTL